MPLTTMRLSLIQQTVEELREASWLRAIEAGDTTVQDLMRVTGLGRSQVYDRLKRARENRTAGEPEPCDGYDDEGTDHLPYLAITDDPSRESGDWYEPESGMASVDRGSVRISDHNGRRLLVRSINGGRKTEEAIKQHEPDPSGLKGGVG